MHHDLVAGDVERFLAEGGQITQVEERTLEQADRDYFFTGEKRRKHSRRISREYVKAARKKKFDLQIPVGGCMADLEKPPPIKPSEERKAKAKAGLTKNGLKALFVMSRQEQTKRMHELKARFLESKKLEPFVIKLFDIAMDDDHPGQMSAMKMIADRILPSQSFSTESKKSSGVTINITGLQVEAKPEERQVNDISEDSVSSLDLSLSVAFIAPRYLSGNPRSRCKACRREQQNSYSWLENMGLPRPIIWSFCQSRTDIAPPVTGLPPIALLAGLMLTTITLQAKSVDCSVILVIGDGACSGLSEIGLII